MGTELEARGVRVPDHVTSVWSALALDESPDAVVGVHRDHLAAGAEVITANNYAVTRPLLAREGLDHRLDELTLRAVELAERARAEAAGPRPVRVAGVVAAPRHLLSRRPGGARRGDPGRIRPPGGAAGRPGRHLVVRDDGQRPGGPGRGPAVTEAAADTDTEVWVSWTMQGNRPGRLPSGETIEAAFASVAELLVDAHLVNCCGANFVADAVRRLRNFTDTPVGGYANSSHVDPLPLGADPVAPDQVEYVPQTTLDIEGYAAEVATWLDAGATIVGGCCYTTPAHIARLRRLLDERADAEA